MFDKLKSGHISEHNGQIQIWIVFKFNSTICSIKPKKVAILIHNITEYNQIYLDELIKTHYYFEYVIV